MADTKVTFNLLTALSSSGISRGQAEGQGFIAELALKSGLFVGGEISSVRIVANGKGLTVDDTYHVADADGALKDALDHPFGNDDHSFAQFGFEAVDELLGWKGLQISPPNIVLNKPIECVVVVGEIKVGIIPE